MGTDGSGITTLVTFMGCPLKCKYCLNKKCHERIFEADGKTLRNGIMMLTPQDKVTIKVPHIPGFNDDEDLDEVIEEIKQSYGFTNISRIEYKKIT
jgi:pyruvate-formate lyase-activating enzyme